MKLANGRTRTNLKLLNVTSNKHTHIIVTYIT